MKVVILAGGYGTRLSEETSLIPKPMVEVGGRPILWHIMKIYSYYGFNDFIILTGYKSHIIKDFFVGYYKRYSDITVDMAQDSVEIHKSYSEPWKVTILYTGQDTMTGSRIKKSQKYLNNECFMLTYGDGVCDVDIKELLKFHENSKRLVTLTSVCPAGKFGALAINDNNQILSFVEKPKENQNWINGGFFVCEPQIFDYIPQGDKVIFEKEPLENLVKDGQLSAYKHNGFWHSMDTLKDKNDLTAMWAGGKAPWALWLK